MRTKIFSFIPGTRLKRKIFVCYMISLCCRIVHILLVFSFFIICNFEEKKSLLPSWMHLNFISKTLKIIISPQTVGGISLETNIGQLVFAGTTGNMFDLSPVICVGGDHRLHCWACASKLWHAKYLAGFYILLWHIANYNILWEKLDRKVYQQGSIQNSKRAICIML